jgi:hypothetical protein
MYVPNLIFWSVVGALSATLVLTVPLPWRKRFIALVALAWLGLANQNLVADSALVALPAACAFNACLTRRTSVWSWAARPALGILSLTKFTLMPVSILVVASGALLRQRSLRVAVREPIIF